MSVSSANMPRQLNLISVYSEDVDFINLLFLYLKQNDKSGHFDKHIGLDKMGIFLIYLICIQYVGDNDIYIYHLQHTEAEFILERWAPSRKMVFCSSR